MNMQQLSFDEYNHQNKLLIIRSPMSGLNSYDQVITSFLRLEFKAFGMNNYIRAHIDSHQWLKLPYDMNTKIIEDGKNHESNVTMEWKIDMPFNNQLPSDFYIIIGGLEDPHQSLRTISLYTEGE